MNNYSRHTHNDLPSFVQAFFTRYQGRPMFSCLGKTLSYCEVDTLSNQFANFLLSELHLQKGDRLAIQLPNCLQYAIAVYGAIKAGIVIVNCNPMYTPREMKHQFNDSGARALLIFKPMLAKLAEIKADVGVEHVIVTDIMDVHDWQGQSVLAEDGSYNLLPAISGQDDLFVADSYDSEAICLLQYTGGTTGVSKGAMLCHRNMIVNTHQAINQAAEMFREQQELMVQPLPLYHITAFASSFFMQASQGNEMLLIPNPSDIEAFISQLQGVKFTIFCGINTLFVGLCQHPKFADCDFSQFNTTISGGATLTEAAIEVWERVTGCKISEGYGLSETAPVVAINDPLDIDYGSVGKEVYGTEVKMVDADGNEVSKGERGELIVKGPQVMLGYWQRPEATADVMTADGFFHTGDVAYRNENDNICIVDRIKDMILVSGFNVYPNEIEMVLTSHQDVIEAAVIGKPDDKTGERIEAFLTTNGDVSVEQLKDYCRENLVAYKVPKIIHIVDQLPKSSVGKILRRELR